MSGDLEFANGKSVILPMNGNQFTFSLYGRNGDTARYYEWMLPTNPHNLHETVALRSDLSNGLSVKVDSELSTPTRTIPVGLYWGSVGNVTANDLIAESTSAFTDLRNQFIAEADEDGFWVKCTRARIPNRTLVENTTKGTSTDQVNVPIWFDVGDEGEIHDGDEDYDDICVAENVIQELPQIRMTIGESISARLSSYAKSDDVPLSTSQLANDSGFTTQSDLDELSSAYVRRNANTITTAGTTTDYLINSSLAGGVRIRWSSTDLNNYTSYGYRGLTARRNGQSDDYILDNSANGIARFKDISAIVSAYLVQHGVIQG